ncbi:MAG: hypothetical protein K0R72_392 [Clostridia bacterium]|nr:hypothetical protein [Clostridia bacterium]
MLYNKMFSKIIIIAVICFITNGALIYAVDEENAQDSSVLKVTEEQSNAKVTDAEFATIEKLLEYINKELKNIDEKLDESRTLPEYDKYPAVRLNIDTPYFGIYSIINSKLKIRDNVSAVDISNGYSIKSVVNKKTIKIESFEVSNVVVITRDLTIDKNMSSSDAQICIFKLLDYLAQAKSVNKFLDKQFVAMISGYFSKDKNDVTFNINQQIDEIEENLGYSSIELSYISAITENDVTEDTKTLYGYKDEVANIKTKVKNVLTSQTKLDVIYDDILKTNEKVKLFRFNINKKFLEVSNNIDLEKSSKLIASKMNNEITYLQNFLDKSKKEISKQNDQNGVQGTTAENTNVVNEIYTQTKEYEELYKTASESIIQNMVKDIDKVNVIVNKILKNNLITEGEELQNKEKLDSKALIDELIQVYIAFLNKENVFLTENAKINITEAKKSDELNISSYEDFEYLYINISDVLTSISNNYDSKSIISNVKTANSLKQVIDKVILIESSSKNKQITNP